MVVVEMFQAVLQAQEVVQRDSLRQRQAAL